MYLTCMNFKYHRAVVHYIWFETFLGSGTSTARSKNGKKKVVKKKKVRKANTENKLSVRNIFYI